MEKEKAKANDFSLIYLTTFPIRQNMTKVFSVQGHRVKQYP